MGFFGSEKHADTRKPESAIPRRDFQSAESHEFQYTELDRLHAADREQPERIVWNGGRDLEHFHDGPAGAVRREAALVTQLTVCAGSGSITDQWRPIPLLHSKFRT